MVTFPRSVSYIRRAEPVRPSSVLSSEDRRSAEAALIAETFEAFRRDMLAYASRRDFRAGTTSPQVWDTDLERAWFRE